MESGPRRVRDGLSEIPGGSRWASGRALGDTVGDSRWPERDRMGQGDPYGRAGVTQTETWREEWRRGSTDVRGHSGLKRWCF